MAVQLLTPVTLVTWWWDHNHALVEPVESGRLLNHTAVSRHSNYCKPMHHLHVTHTVIDCGLLTDTDNGQVDTFGTFFGSIAIYTCDTGYTLFGSRFRTCIVNGLWTSPKPLCEGSRT